MTKFDVERNLTDTQALLNIWLKIRQLFMKACSKAELTTEDEHKFLQYKSETARYQRTLSQRVEALIHFGSNQMSEFMRQSVSLFHIRQLPVNDRKTLYHGWHHVFVLLSRTNGAFKFMKEEGFKITPKELEERQSDKKKRKATGRSAEEKKKFVLIGVGVVIVIGVLYWLLG